MTAPTEEVLASALTDRRAVRLERRVYTGWSDSAKRELLLLDQLFLACARGDAPAWEQFVARYDRVIKVTALRVARRWGCEHLRDDLAQHVYAKLCSHGFKALAGFVCEAPNADFAYVRVFAANACRDHCKSVCVRPDASNMALGVDQISEPRVNDDSAERSIQVHEAELALRRRLPPANLDRDIRIFYLYYLQGYTSAAIATLPGIGLSVAGVDSAVHRFKKILVEELGGERGG